MREEFGLLHEEGHLMVVCGNSRYSGAGTIEKRVLRHEENAGRLLPAIQMPQDMVVVHNVSNLSLIAPG